MFEGEARRIGGAPCHGKGDRHPAPLPCSREIGTPRCRQHQHPSLMSWSREVGPLHRSCSGTLGGIEAGRKALQTHEVWKYNGMIVVPFGNLRFSGYPIHIGISEGF
eukprot:gnl/TRDRNA2_/TRDRNA2_177887_c2_seq1.p1 gnl/TRDRNA2_/TRDRNA2_177887_c2~~gnl/TRDRNA2_/TRDRNA2_177887_c2_seq1.p1  ORF type:complete len:107 (-),score=0.25 gnl/TRDRNA2_/TRDRNA2_177887_c2_seq1:96-416(-)